MTHPDDGPAPLDPVELRLRAKSGQRSAARLWSLIRKSTRLVWQAGPRKAVALALLQVVTAGLLAAQVIVVERLVSAVVGLSSGATMQDLLIPLVAFAALTTATTMAGAVQNQLGRLLGESVTRLMWRSVSSIATTVTLRHFESPDFYDLLQRVQGNSARPFQVTQALTRILGGLTATVGVGLVLYTINPILVPLLAIGGIPLILTNRAESRLEFRFAVDQTTNQRERSYLTFLLTGRTEAKEIRAYDLGSRLSERLDRRHGEYVDALDAHVRRRLRLSLLGNFISAILLAGTMVAVAWFIADGQIDVSQAGAAVVAIRMLQGQLQTLLGGIQTIFESGLFLEDVDMFLRLGVEAEQDEDGDEAPIGFNTITIDDLRFRYPGSDTDALRGVSTHIERGSLVALVGENGSGKTTLAKILAGLYDSDQGAVRWDGRDTREFSRASVRSRVAVIFQDFARYAFTARENVAAGDGTRPIDDERVLEASRAAGADVFVSKLPQKYDTILSRLFHGGRDLSGGQWQRIAIARAFYRDAPLVILDEPTASLDARAEYDLFASLRAVLKGRTAVFVSHRFSTVRMADQIIVLHAGRIVEAGTHSQLMAQDGRYSELFRLQASAYLTDNDPV